MKRFFTILLITFMAFSSMAETIEKVYYFNNPTVKSLGMQQEIRFSNTLTSGIAGEPALPYNAVNLLLPPGHEAISISFQGFDETELAGYYVLAPAQHSKPISEPGKSTWVENQEIYRSNQPYPKTQTGTLSTRFMNGYSYAQTVFTPVIYNPIKGQISFYKKVVIRIETRATTKGREALKNLSSAPVIINKCAQKAQNPDAIHQYPVKRTTTNDYQILIITPQAFAEQISALSDLYLPRGMKSQITTTQFIEANSNGIDMPEKIRNYIIEQYQQNGIEHVVLGGDVEHVAYRGFYCHVQSSSVYEDNNIPSDLYYSALDGNWNTNGNNLWGEIGEDDLLPEISVGRLSFSNTAELAAMINKTTKYQNQPVLGELRNPLLAGENLYSGPDTWGSDYLELLIGTHDDNGYTTTGIPEDHNFVKLYDEVDNWSATDLKNTINAGRNFIHHVGHANESTVMKFYTSDITNANFQGVNGITHNFPVISTHGCICGAFDVSDCIAEKMVSIENFAAAFIGNSRYGWFNEGQTEGPSAHLHREFVDAMFTDSLNRAGQAQSESKATTSPWVNAPGQWEEGALRWCFYDCNLLGDPAMAIWTNEPISINTVYPASLTIGTNQFEISVTNNGTPIKGLTAALLKNGMLYGKGSTGSDGTATVTIDPLIVEPGEAQLVISGYNCLPTYYTITFLAGESPFVVYLSHTINDSEGNNNGLADFGENLKLNITLRNIGLAEAQNVTASIASDDPYVTITDANETYGNIAANGQSAVENGFSLLISNEIPDNHIIDFSLIATANETWNSSFQIQAYAPVIEAGTASVDDAPGNGIPDPGETFNLNINVLNTGHSNSLPVTAQLHCNDPFINGSLWQTDPVSISALSSENMSFMNIEASAQTPLGTPVIFTLTLTQGSEATVILEKEYIFVIGQVAEDFETGDFTRHPWELSGNGNWTISQTNPYEGLYCAKSGAISDNQKSNLSVNYEVLTNDSIKFCLKVSSESSYDYLRFYIDNVKIGEWSGEEAWQQVAYAVSAGTHSFKWSYEKDISVSNGEDAAWIDNIIFPPVDTFTGISTPEVKSSLMTIYPNPSAGLFTLLIAAGSGNHSTITITDQTGKLIFEKTNVKGGEQIQFNEGNIPAGMYFVRLSNQKSTSVQKIIIN